MKLSAILLSTACGCCWALNSEGWCCCSLGRRFAPGFWQQGLHSLNLLTGGELGGEGSLQRGPIPACDDLTRCSLAGNLHRTAASTSTADAGLIGFCCRRRMGGDGAAQISTVATGLPLPSLLTPPQQKRALLLSSQLRGLSLHHLRDSTFPMSHVKLRPARPPPPLSLSCDERGPISTAIACNLHSSLPLLLHASPALQNTPHCFSPLHTLHPTSR